MANRVSIPDTSPVAHERKRSGGANSSAIVLPMHTWMVMELTMPMSRRDSRSSLSFEVRRDLSSSRSVSWINANNVCPLASCERTAVHT